MAKPRTPHFDTLSLHAGAAPDPATGARATPIYQSASFVFPDGDHAAALFDMERAGHVYSRISNPTCAVLEERIAALEGGVGAIATASGQAALHLAIVTLLSAGSHIVASRALYGGSHNLLDYTLPRFGIETTFVDGRDLDAWRAAIRPKTRLLFGETLGNPGLDVLDIPRVAELAHEHGAAAARRLDVHDAVPDAAVRARRGPRLPLGDQVPVRPRRRDRRPAGRFGAVRLERAGVARQVSDADRAVRGLPRHGVRRGVDDRRVPAARAARGHARLRRVHGAVHRVPDPAGDRDAAAAHGAPRREHAQGRRLSRRAPAGRRRSRYPELADHPDHALAQKLLPNGLRRGVQLQPRGDARAGTQVHRVAEALLASRQRRRREIARDPSGEHDAFPDVGGGAREGRASPRERSACRSASSTRTT